MWDVCGSLRDLYDTFRGDAKGFQGVSKRFSGLQVVSDSLRELYGVLRDFWEVPKLQQSLSLNLSGFFFSGLTLFDTFQSILRGF